MQFILRAPRQIGYLAVRIGYPRSASGTREQIVTMPTTEKPAWLDAAAKLDAMLGDKVPLSSPRSALPPTDVEVEDKPEAKLEPSKPESPPKAKPRSRLGGTPRATAAKGEEVDLAWQGFSSRAMLPSTILLTAATAAVVVWVRPLVPSWIVNEAVDAPVAACWLFQAVRWLYRTLAFQFRLTNRRLFRERGQLYPAEKPLDLALAVRAEARQTLLERICGVGSVLLVMEEASENQPPFELSGVRRPATLATRIDEAIKMAREGNVVALRMES